MGGEKTGWEKFRKKRNRMQTQIYICITKSI